MRLEEKPEFIKLFTAIAELYNRGVSLQLLDVYWYALEKYPFEKVKWALGYHTVNPDTAGQFMPKPSDVVRYIEGNSQEKALFAWQKVVAAMRHIGSYQSIIFDDLLIHYVVDLMGGWITLCHSHEDKLPFLFQDFTRRYTSCLPHKVSCPAQLTGVMEHLNHLHGFSTPVPVLFDGTNISLPQALEEEHHHDKSAEIECFGESEENA